MKVTRIAKRLGCKGVLDVFLIDEADAPLVDSYRYWYTTPKGYVYTVVGTKYQWLTYLLLGSRQGFEVDHADREPLNNSRENLRFVTHADNMANCRTRRHSKSGVKGVKFHRQSGLWAARINVGRQIGLGYYRSESEAAAVFIVAHRYFHPALFPGFDNLLHVFGITEQVWQGRGARRARTGSGRYAVEPSYV